MLVFLFLLSLTPTTFLAPLIMGNDLRLVPTPIRDQVLLNEEAIAIDESSEETP